MITIVIRIATIALIVYSGLAALLYFQQNRFIFPAPQQVVAPSGGYEAVTLKTEDGLSLMAHWRAPDDGKPTVVHFHGNAGSLLGSGYENALFAADGYGVLLVEYRGYGGNPGDPSEEGLKKDGRAAMAFLKTRSIPLQNTIIKGHSIGTGTAVNMAMEYEAGALILVAPFTSVPDLIERRLPVFPLRLLIESEFDNVAKAVVLNMPVLVQHGTADTVIPESHGRAVSEAIAGSAYKSVAGADHDLSGDPAVQAQQLDWLAKKGLSSG